MPNFNVKYILWKNITKSLTLFLTEAKNNTLMGFVENNVELQREVRLSLLPIMENWSGIKLKRKPVIYGIRKYLRGAWLGLHVDRLPTHIISVILQVSDKKV